MKIKFIFFLSFFSFYLQAAIKIDSIQKIDSRCLNTGNIIVFASSTSQIIYSYELSGTNSPSQTFNSFSNLGPGNYIVRVVNLQNEKDSLLMTINSNYQTPDFTQTVINTTCKNNSDGIVIGNRLLSKGLSPYSWKLKNNITNITISQTNDTFKNLASGDYTLSLTDSCLNTTAHNFQVGNTVTNLKFNYTPINLINCTSLKIETRFSKTGNYDPNLIKYEYNGITIIKPPIIVFPSTIIDTFNFKIIPGKILKTTLYNYCGDSVSNLMYLSYSKPQSTNYSVIGCDSTNIFFNSNSNLILFDRAYFKSKNGVDSITNINNQYFNFLFKNSSHNDTIKSTYFTTCNDTFTDTFIIPSLKSEILIGKTIYQTSCNSQNQYHFKLRNSKIITKDSIYCKLIDINGNMLKDTTIEKYGEAIFKNGIPFNKYYLIVKNGCGLKDTVDFVWAASSSIKSSNVVLYKQDVCLDSTISISIETNGFSNIKITNFTGPKTISNTKSKYGFIDSFNYNIGINGVNSTKFFFTNIGVGKYYYTVSDSCSSLNDSFEIKPEDVSNNYYSVDVIKQCQDKNKIKLKLYSIHAGSSFGKMVFGLYSIKDLQTNSFLRTNIPIKFDYNWNNGFLFLDSFDYLTVGNFELKIFYTYSNYSNTYPKFTKNQTCNIIIDTIRIPIYNHPSISSFVKIKCNNQNYIQLNADSNKGTPPYRFEINQGSQTYPLQNNNIFLMNNPGSYQAKIWDTCGNATTYNFNIDTFNFVPISINDSSCNSSSAILTYQSSPFFTYRWQRPNGSFYVGDTLKLQPVLISDVGRYKITKFVNFNGCQDSFKTEYNLIKSKVNQRYDTILEGDSALFKSNFLKISGIYTDTFLKLPCDSFDVFNLWVKDTYLYDTISKHLCYKDTFWFKGKAYPINGTYYDTVDIINAPDSIYVLDLIINLNLITKHIYDTILVGDSVFFNMGFKDTSDIYKDTFKILTCDSFVFFHLYVKDTVIDIVTNIKLCYGDSILYHGNYYKTTGTYNTLIDVNKKPDTLFKLNLYVNPPVVVSTIKQIHCNSFTYKSKILNQDTIITDTLKASLGCDSIIIINDNKVLKTKYVTDSIISACEKLIYKSKTYTQSINKVDSIQSKFKNSINCDSAVKLINLVILPRPILTIQASIPNPVTKGDLITLNASGASKYYWNLNESTAQSIQYIAYRNKTFSLIGISSNFCSDTIKYSVYLQDSFQYSVRVPTGFTPNGDGNNDIMYIRMTDVKRLVSFKIFNRWGQLVFYTTDENQGWDGYYKNVMQNSDTYFYSYEIETLNNKIKGGEGNFNLLR